MCKDLKKKDVHLCDIGNTFERSYMGKNLDISLGYHFLKWPSTSVFVQRVHACSFIFMHYYFFCFVLFLFCFFYREAVHHWQHKLSTGSSLYFLYDFCFPSRSLFLHSLMSSLSCLTSLFLSLPLSIIFFFFHFHSFLFWFRLPSFFRFIKLLYSFSSHFSLITSLLFDSFSSTFS